MRIWQVFLDESGDVTDARERFGVIGWVVEGYGNQHLQGQLDEAVDRIVRQCDRSSLPAHQAHLNQVGTHALVAWKRAEKELAVASNDRALVAAVNSWPSIRKVGWESMWRPRFEDAKAVGRWLRQHHPAAYGRADAKREEVNEKIPGVLRALAGSLGRPPFAVAGFDDGMQRGVAFDPKTRYRAAFELVLERVVMTLRGQGGVAWVHASTATFQRHKLAYPDLNAWAGDVRKRLDSWRGPQITLAKVLPNERKSGLKLADLIANRLRSVATQHSGDWRSFVAESDKRVVFPVEAPLPTVAHAGTAAGVLRGEARRDALASVRPAWAAEQAERWLPVIEEGRS